MIGFVFLRVLLSGLMGLAPAGGPPGVHTAPIMPVDRADLPAGFDFGDDTGVFANDGECDDGRFAGDGMGVASDDNAGHDATDCRAAWEAGSIHLYDGPDTGGIIEDGINFGDDAGMWSNDNECDDKRFTGAGMTETVLLDDDIGHDATDCRNAWASGDLSLFEPVSGDLVVDGVHFGDDSGDWANDNQCDDPRFSGEAMTDQPYDANKGRDASDCAAAWQAGRLTLTDQNDATDIGDAGTSGITTPWIEDGVDFGTDSGAWSNDGECDDPRFVGEGMTATTLLDEDIRADASDCLAGWRAGTLTLREDGAQPAKGSGPGGNSGGGASKIGNSPGQR